MFLASETNLMLALAVVAGVLLLVAIATSAAAMRWLGRLRDAEQELAKADRRVEHAERRTFTVLNAVPVALVETDAQGKFVFANKAAHQVLGRRDSELLGLRFHSATWGISYPDGRLVPPDLLPAARALRGQTVKGFQHMIAHPSTRRKLLVAATSMPITNEMGEITGSTTAIVELESFGAMEMGEDGAPKGPGREEILFESTPIPLWRIDAQGTILGANQAAFALNGCRAEDLADAPFSGLIKDEADRARFEKLVDTARQAEPETQIRVHLVHKDASGQVEARDVCLFVTRWSLDEAKGGEAGLYLAGFDLTPYSADFAQKEADLRHRLDEGVRAPAAGGVGTWRRSKDGDRFEDQTARTLFGRDHPEDRRQSRFETALKAVFEGRAEGVELDVALVRPDGELRHLALRGRAERQNDEVSAVYGVVFDVTDLKIALSEAHAQGEALRQTADAIPALVRLSGPDHEVDLVNGLWRSFTGQGIADAEGQGFIDAVHAEDRAGLTQTLAAAHERRGNYRLTYRLYHKGDGAYRRVMESGTPRFALDGTFMGYAASAFDVSEEAAMRDALAEREGRYRTLAEAPPYLGWSARAEGGLDYVSPQWTVRTGLSKEALLGTGWQDLQHPEDRALIADAFGKAARGDGLLSVDFRLKQRDGTYRWVRSQGVAVRDVDGKIARWFGALFDIEDLTHRLEALNEQGVQSEIELDKYRKTLLRTEAALDQAQRMETVGRLTGGVAMDFSNLLTLLIRALDLIQKQSDNSDKVKRLAEAALSAGTCGERFTRQLQALSERQEPHLEPLDPGLMLMSFEPMLRRAAGTASMTILAVEGLSPVRVDRVQFEATLLNLVMNARDAVAEGGQVTVRAERVRLSDQEVSGCAQGRHIKISVMDTGTGMDADVLARAFDPFFTTKPQGKGSGLGLTQVQNFAKSSQGGVRIDSSPGRGTLVELYLPEMSPEAGANNPEAEGIEAAAEPLKTKAKTLRPGLKVLVVEGEDARRHTLETLMTDLGCVVQTARNGPQAMSVIEDLEEDLDLMLADAVMPGGLNGVELAKAIRHRHPQIQIVLTADAALSVQMDGLGHNITVLARPYEDQALVQTVKQILA